MNLKSQIQAHNLVRFSKHAKVLGNGLAVIDFGSRVGNIHNSYKAGDNWERELCIESTSFALSAIAGSLAIGFITVATPVGWVALIIGPAALSMGINIGVQNNAGDVYDEIMRWL